MQPARHSLKKYSTQWRDEETGRKADAHCFSCHCGHRGEGFATKAARDRAAERHLANG